MESVPFLRRTSSICNSPAAKTEAYKFFPRQQCRPLALIQGGSAFAGMTVVGDRVIISMKMLQKLNPRAGCPRDHSWTGG
jgi:hypothetical protein